VELIEAAGVTIAAIAGHCTGPDFEQVLAADIRIAGDGASFSALDVADAEACARRLTRLLGEAGAKELLLAGRTLPAETALRLRLVSRVVAGAALGETALAAAETLRALPPLGLRAVREAVRAGRDLTPREALTLEHEHFRRLVATRDHKAAVAAFLDRRAPAFTGE
jgi:enoyl-CoA hydratase/carnithine racemase